MDLFSWVSDPSAWVALLTLTILEIVLGIDNIIFISILSGKLPPEERAKARNLGLAVALISRILLLLSIKWVMGLTDPVFTVPWLGASAEAQQVNWRDIILGVGGMFLIWKSVKEIHHKLEGDESHGESGVKATLPAIIAQIFVLDIVFSLDSVITAVGMADKIGVMIVAVVIAVGFMLFFARSISEFVEKHPTIKVLALSFLILIGVNLVAESTGMHIPKAYTYFAMAFAVIVEMINLRVRHKSGPAS
ncbi:MAG: TerC family protein [Chthonomonas sp.]|nr:TerC family protein [Chthonomonas sp.]